MERLVRKLIRLPRQARRAVFGDDPIVIVPYRGFGCDQQIYLRGRVLEEPGIVPSSDDDTLWNNIANSIRRFESDEIPGARVRAHVQGDVCEAIADKEGYFEIDLRLSRPLPDDRLWHQISLELLSPLRSQHKPAQTRGEVLAPSASACFGIISDIDDTVVQTNVADRIRMARDVFLGNARTRLPFKGVAAFYRALYQGRTGSEQNPLFCVSSSPWNLYDQLSEFFELHAIPTPVLFLRDWGISLKSGHRHHTHKLAAIQRIMAMYPEMSFILIGDSGQEDPEIYYEVVRAYPGRVPAVYIRNVSRAPERAAAIRKLADQVVAAGSTLVLTDDTLAAAQHAAAQGWINPASLDEIATEKAIDAAKAPAAEAQQDAETPTVIVSGEGEGLERRQ